jgi:ribosomal protein L16 Arg81 hydroxylase
VYVPAADELIGDQRVFFDRYFNRSPMLRRDALRGDPRELLSVAELDEVLSSEAIRPPYLDIAKDGRQVPRSSYTEPIVVQGEYVTDRVVPERVAALFRAGATLTWNSINHHRPGLRALTGLLGTLFATHGDVIAFLTPAGRRGLAPHYDPVDVFVIQLEGTKTWRVWPVPQRRRGDDVGNLDEASLGEPAVAATLRPGDVLYMPYNCAHVAVAEDQVSLHLSVTVAPRRWTGLLQEVVARLVTDDPAFWGNPWLRGDAAAAELSSMLAALAQRLQGVDPAAEVERLIADGIRPAGVEVTHHLRDATAADAIGPRSLLARAESVPVQIIEQTGDKVRARVDGAVYTLPRRVVDAVEALPDGHRLLAGSLLAGASDELSTRTARTLVRMGVLRAVGDEGA